MAKEYQIDVYGQPSLQEPKDRTITIIFDEPDNDINEDTGILLLIAGYGGTSSANVYKKMRSQFADAYNLVTLQCDYFGSEFMQAPDKDIRIPEECLRLHFSKEEVDALMNDVSSHEHLLTNKTFVYPITLDESPSNYNDMGPVQAMDQLIALKVVSDILEDNHYSYNKHKVIAYGQSHGAYLAHLCNCYMPGVFSAIIDNSSYLQPYFMEHSRDFLFSVSDYQIVKQIQYMAAGTPKDNYLYSLPYLYGRFSNQAQIIAFQGEEDNMTTPKEKEEFLNMVPHTHYELIDSSRVDKDIFHSTFHGMDADFLKLFAYVHQHYTLENSSPCLEFKDRLIQTPDTTYSISLEDSIPILYQKGAD